MTSKTLVHRRAEGLIARPAIEAALERALALVRDIGARGFGPQVCFERSELARLTGDDVPASASYARRIVSSWRSVHHLCHRGREGARFGDRLVSASKTSPRRPQKT